MVAVRGRMGLVVLLRRCPLGHVPPGSWLDSGGSHGQQRLSAYYDDLSHHVGARSIGRTKGRMNFKE
jgi:hypothetical protein